MQFQRPLNRPVCFLIAFVVTGLIGFPPHPAFGQDKNQSTSSSCTTCDIAGVDGQAKPTVQIRWKRLVDKNGKTDRIFLDAEKEIKDAATALKERLQPLGVEVKLELVGIDAGKHQKNPFRSNRIWINGKAFEMYLPDSNVGEVIGDNQQKYRAIQFGGMKFRNIPSELIVQVGILAAADSIKQTMADRHAVGLVSKQKKTKNGGSCCEMGGGCCEKKETGSCEKCEESKDEEKNRVKKNLKLFQQRLMGTIL